MLELDNKWQNTFSLFALGAIVVLAIAYVAFSAVIYTQLKDLDIGQSNLKSDFADIKSDLADLKIDVSGLKSDVAGLKTNQDTILERFVPPLE